MKTPNPRRRGIALVVTLLVIVILTITVTAFMQSMSLERKTSQAYLNILKADAAARAGLEKAIGEINHAISDRRTYVTGNYQPENPDGTININLAPIVVISGAGGDSDLFAKPIPLISKTQPDSAFERPTASPTPATVGAGFAALDTVRTSGTGATSYDLNRNQAIQENGVPKFYNVPLEALLSPTGDTVANYGFMVLDEQARIAPTYHRNLSRSQPEDYPADASDMPLDLGLDSSSKARLLSSASVAALPAKNLLAISPCMIGQAFPNHTEMARVKHLLGGYKTFNEDVIPAGYASAGKPKYNINDLATNPSNGATAALRAENIGTIIDANLPAFKERDPALVAFVASASPANPNDVKKRYNNRLAASIVDYIDTDSTPTLVNSGEPAGRDLFPMAVAVAEKLQRGAPSGPDAAGNYSITFTSQLYVQVWNPYTKSTSGTPRFKLGNRMRVTFGSGVVTPLTDYDQTASGSVTVRPNEMKVIAFPSANQTFTSSTNANPKWASGSPSESADQTTHLYFELRWDGVLADMNRRPPVGPSTPLPAASTSGLTRSAKTFSVTTPGYQCSFAPSNTGTPSWRFAGDPRGTYLSNYDWGTPISADGTYSSSTLWQGRQQNTSPRWQEFNTSWTARDFVRAAPNSGSAPGSVNTAPDAVVSTYSVAVDGKNAVAFIRNANMRSIGELGHIFDPAQADDAGQAPAGGTPSSYCISSGGRTLRIGQPEASYWDAEDLTQTPEDRIKNSKRAANLLDIFSTNSINALKSTNYPQSQGRININTAPKEVLVALFYNLGLYTDQTWTSPYVINYDQALVLAQAVIDNRPFHKLSDFRVMTSLLAKSATYATQGSPPPAQALTETNPPDASLRGLAVMDRAREEVFNRLLNSVALQSRAYRVFSYGRSLNSQGKVSAQSMLEAIVEIEPDGVDPANPSAPLKMKAKVTSIKSTQ